MEEKGRETMKKRMAAIKQVLMKEVPVCRLAFWGLVVAFCASCCINLVQLDQWNSSRELSLAGSYSTQAYGSVYVVFDKYGHYCKYTQQDGLLENSVGSAGGAVAAAMSVVVIPTENILAVVVLTRYNGGKVSLKEIILDIFKNPLVLGCLAGLAVLLLRLELPQFLLSTCSQLAAACTPICLLGLGATIRFQEVHQSLHRILIAVAARLVVVPAVLISLAVALGFRGTDLAVITVGFSSSVAATAFPLCQQLGGDSKLIANIVVFTSVLACFAIFLYTFLLKELGLI